MKILLALFIIYLAAVAIIGFIGNQEIKTLIEEGVLSSDYTQLELAMLCENPDDDVQPILGCIVGGIW